MTTGYERQLCPILWSTPDSKQDDGTIIKGHYDRTTCKLNDQELKVLFNQICDSSGKHTDDPVECDVNGDGEFNVSDVVLLQKWLLAIPGTDLADWQAADLSGDSALDITDLCLMRQKLVNG